MKQYLSIVALIPLLSCQAQEEEVEELTILEVMEQAHESGLYKKIRGGESTPEEAAELLRLYQALQKNSAPQGDPDNWNEMTEALVNAAQMVVDGDPAGPGAIRRAANCRACHTYHKPD